MNIKTVVMCDAENKELDAEYAENLINAFRKRTGWKVEEGTRIHKDLTEFSKAYSKERRNVEEVCVIFMIAIGLMKL